MSPISSRKSVPPSACSNLPVRSRDRAGERALHVPEQLALDQLGRDRGAVDLDERRRRGAGERWWSARATSSLPVPFSPVISTRAVGRAHPLDQLAAPPGAPGSAPPSRSGVSATARSRSFSAVELALRQRVPQRDQQAVGVERLLQEVEGAALGRLHRRGDGAVPRDHHHERRRVLLPQAGERLEAVDARPSSRRAAPGAGERTGRRAVRPGPEGATRTV